ncbi:Retrovirus-related Pol polyprotein from transposon RE1 [Vitis vinifera]|uniref:Retrovirus-related Pol polyprotein from transposon RE1 n=1 Tax=Vitis vinifera TaxID=29760 RepID=A0A438IJL6_VITVI|nr:Retrovirus-related Pol polyprotein from transposon RE1 [Vitis vinifera]
MVKSDYDDDPRTGKTRLPRWHDLRTNKDRSFIHNLLWQELDLADDFQWTCTEDCKRFKARINKERIYDFLAGLNQDLDVVHSRILAIKSLPEIEEVFAEVRREETHKRVMLDPTKTTVLVPSGDNSALTARGKLYGKPQNWKDNKENRSTSQNPRVFQIASKPGNKTGENVSLNKDQLEQLYKLLTPSVATVSPPLGLNTSFLAQKCTFRTALSNTTEKLDPWIIDSSASNHMTGWFPCNSCKDWYNCSNPHITLYDVLHVPKLACNLLSISKLTKDLDYSVQFLPSHCEFQEVTSGNRIGSAKELGGLYYFEDDNFENKQAFTASSIAPNQPAASELSQFQSTVAAEPSQLQPTAIVEPSQLQSTTTIEPVVPTTDYNIRPGGAQQHQQELRVYSWHIRPRDVESTMVFQPYQELDPTILPEVNDLNLPIVVRKGTRLAKTETPKNIYEALNKSEWKKAILEEMAAPNKNHTWEIVNKPEEKTPVGCKWVFAIKYKSDGSINRYKARLAAKDSHKLMELITKKHSPRFPNSIP